MIKEVVGSKTYSVWTDMLKRLVPGGRTHRLSIVAAGMLQVAYEIAGEKEKSNVKAKKFVAKKISRRRLCASQLGLGADNFPQREGRNRINGKQGRPCSNPYALSLVRSARR